MTNSILPQSQEFHKPPAASPPDDGLFATPSLPQDSALLAPLTDAEAAEEASASPLPAHTQDDLEVFDQFGVIGLNTVKDGRQVCAMTLEDFDDAQRDGEDEANAHRLALCWNCHDALYKACVAVVGSFRTALELGLDFPAEEVAEMVNNDGRVKLLETAIAKVQRWQKGRTKS